MAVTITPGLQTTHANSNGSFLRTKKDGGKIGTVFAVVQYIGQDNINVGKASLEILNIDKGNVLHEDKKPVEFEPGSNKMYVVSETPPDTDALDEDEIELNLNITQVDDNGGFRMSYGNTLQSQHKHEPASGLIETFDNEQKFPENCDVLINGDPVGLSIGDGTSFEESVDIKGELEIGQVNIIEITSSTLGHMQAWIEGDVYRMILGAG